jgi:membrane-bound lytic murein transglycosylase A
MSFERLSLLPSLILLASLVGGCSTVAPQRASTPTASAQGVASKIDTLRPVTFKELPGWDKDDLRDSWPAFMASCEKLITKSDWKESCSIARNVNARDDAAVRQFFEAFFVPHQIRNADGSDTGLVTGYYEPLLRGARKRSGAFQTPLHRAPEDLLTIDLASVYPDLKGLRLRGRLLGNKVVPYPPRAELIKSGALNGKELLWVDNPIDAFFLQVQGSGRVQLAEGGATVRLAYADQNGYPYKSIGKYLVDRGDLTLDQASAQGIKAWYIAHPERRQELLNANPSYVFFKEEPITDPKKGPKGALGVPLTPTRSIAIDTTFLPLGAPVYLATTQPYSAVMLQRLMMAQDTGGAIKGAVRADYFWGFGAEAGEQAGKMKQRGMMWVLLPKSASTATPMR